MIDTHLANLKIMPESDLNLQNINSGLELQLKNKVLTNAIYIIVASGLLVLTYFIINHKQNKKPDEN